MVIFVAGLIGTGKTSLARALAEKLGIYYYDVDLVKKEVYPTDPNYEYNLKNNIPFSDETRVKTFHRVVEDFAKLAKKHKHIIVDETLHKKLLRQILFDGAEKYFGTYIIVWVKANEETIKDRLTQNQRKGHILKDPVGMYLAFKKQFENFNTVDIVFENNTPFPESLENLVKLVQAKL
ncbi:MAG: ATP-binding protein [Candidatus Kerfeldbacteria bacterium]|nr:ATP-binding protein [Candidatus Kerfeldbacteria bacterium]